MPVLAWFAALPLAAAALTGPAPAPCTDEPSVVVCAINAQRAANGLKPVQADSSLAALARAHSASMVAHQRFAHGNFGSRIRRSAWAHRHDIWSAGEALAWGTGDRAAPDAIVAAWMRSPPHRRILLDQRYHVVGVGAVAGVPVAGADGQDGQTYTADFGS